MQYPFRLRRAGIALAGAALLLAGAAGANAAGGPQPGTGQHKVRAADAVLVNPAMAPGSELQFISVEPCRILDTRLAGGPLNNSSRAFSAIAPYTAQGGLAAGCGIPASAVSIQVNVGATQVTSVGFVKAWATGSAQPNASILNYNPNAAASNMVTVPLNASGSFTLMTNQRAQLFADVAGYYVKPLYASLVGMTFDVDGTTELGPAVWQGIQSGLVSFERLSVGEYTLTFDRNVSKCAPAATDYIFPIVHEISVDTDFSEDSTVYVSVKDSSTGVPDDTTFHLSLTC